MTKTVLEILEVFKENIYTVPYIFELLFLVVVTITTIVLAGFTFEPGFGIGFTALSIPTIVSSFLKLMFELGVFLYLDLPQFTWKYFGFYRAYDPLMFFSLTTAFLLACMGLLYAGLYGKNIGTSALMILVFLMTTIGLGLVIGAIMRKTVNSKQTLIYIFEFIGSLSFALPLIDTGHDKKLPLSVFVGVISCILIVATFLQKMNLFRAYIPIELPPHYGYSYLLLTIIYPIFIYKLYRADYFK